MNCRIDGTTAVFAFDPGEPADGRQGRDAETDLRHEPDSGWLRRCGRRRHRVARAERRAVSVVARSGAGDRPVAVWAQAMGGHEFLLADQQPNATPAQIEFARNWRDTPKVVFSSSMEKVDWNARLVTGAANRSRASLSSTPVQRRPPSKTDRGPPGALSL
jgi:hypothetical protein